jgi:hypothetical protein
MEADEESVFALVISWVKEDGQARKPELDRLLPRAIPDDEAAE